MKKAGVHEAEDSILQIEKKFQNPFGVDAEIELRKKIDQRVYAHVRVGCCFGKFSINRRYYTILDGRAYEIHNGKTKEIFESVWQWDSMAYYVGKYDPKKTYQQSSNKVSYSEVKTLLK